VKGASVRIRRPSGQAAQKQTDDQGSPRSRRASSPKSEDENRVRFDGGRLRVQAGFRQRRNWEFDPREDSFVGLVFASRHVSPRRDREHQGVLREPWRRAQDTNHRQPIAHRVQGPMAKVSVIDTATSAFGSFHASVKLPLSGRIGSYAIRVFGRRCDHDDSFEVAEFRPAEFKVASSDKPSSCAATAPNGSARRLLVWRPQDGIRPDLGHAQPQLLLGTDGDIVRGRRQRITSRIWST
jgi:hypothetical protein